MKTLILATLLSTNPMQENKVLEDNLTIFSETYQSQIADNRLHCSGRVIISTNKDKDYINYVCSESDYFESNKVYELRKPTVYNRYESFNVQYNVSTGEIQAEFAQHFFEDDVFSKMALKNSLQEKANRLISATNGLMTKNKKA